MIFNVTTKEIKCFRMGNNLPTATALRHPFVCCYLTIYIKTNDNVDVNKRFREVQQKFDATFTTPLNLFNIDL